MLIKSEPRVLQDVPCTIDHVPQVMSSLLCCSNRTRLVDIQICHDRSYYNLELRGYYQFKTTTTTTKTTAKPQAKSANQA